MMVKMMGEAKLDLVISGMRATQWSKVKGELNTMVAVVGCTTPPRDVGDILLAKWEILQQRVDAFIKSVEDDGLHE